ncbi:MAG: protein kinase [Planctomycetes bacterium]|nr:protein kinase [Planctomycetota bacterium]
MPRPADKIFLRIAVDRRVLEAQDADDVWAEMTRLEKQEGEKVKARILCVELGFMDQGLARKIKHEVRATLERMAREESRGQRRVAGFELFEKISSGAMGTVYKARHLKLNKIVALKLLNPDFVGDKSYVARFLLEAQAAATLNHPNVVQAFDVGQTGNVHFIAMEYVEGKTLKELIKRRGCIEESASVEIVLQLLDGLRHAWEHRLVHRDVKPANIMITREGQAKLLDLGLVRRTDQVSELTGDGRAVGTPYFMAPEQALDKGADYRADIYGLGTTLFNMATGEKPYVAGTPVAVMNMHLKAPIPDASEINRDVSKGLAQVITKMLAKRPADRYQDPERLVHDLTTVLQGFMPDLKGGETPIGLDFIAPRADDDGRSGSRGGRSGSAPQRSGYARRRREDPEEEREEKEPQRSWLPIGLAAAAGIMIGVVIFLNSGGEQIKPQQPDEPEVAERDPLAEKEAQAQAAYSALKGDGWERIETLEALAKEYRQTPTGKTARREARDLRTTLTRGEEARYNEADRTLTDLAKAGRLRDAVDGYRDLENSLHVRGLKKGAKQRADELLGILEERSAEAEVEATKLEDAGQERQAAEIRRRRADLFLTEDEAKVEETKAVALEKKATDDERAVGDARRREADIERQREEAKVASLPTTLVDLVTEGELESAIILATETAKSITSAPLRARAEVHVRALEAIVKLQPLALKELAKRTGATVSFTTLKGGKVSGAIESVSGDRITINVLRGALRTVSLNDLKEEVTWKWVRKAQGKKGEAYLRGVTSIKLYRSDKDSLEFLAKCTDAGIDLSALVAELRRIEPDETAVVTGGGPADPQTAGVKRPKTDKERYQEALAEQARVKAVTARRRDIFREADDVGYDTTTGRLEPIYRFFQDGRKFRKEWKLIRGEATPTPPGQMERQGLKLLGRDGRAEFFAPLEEGLDLKLRFLSYGGDRRGRLSVILEGEKNRRVICNLGAVEFRVKRRIKARNGTSKIAEFRSRADVTFEVRREGRFIKTFVNTEETGAIELPEDEELGKFRLVLEWNKVSISLLSLRLLCKPEREWVEKRMKR